MRWGGGSEASVSGLYSEVGTSVSRLGARVAEAAYGALTEEEGDSGGVSDDDRLSEARSSPTTSQLDASVTELSPASSVASTVSSIAPTTTTASLASTVITVVSADPSVCSEASTVFSAEPDVQSTDSSVFSATTTVLFSASTVNSAATTFASPPPSPPPPSSSQPTIARPMHSPTPTITPSSAFSSASVSSGSSLIQSFDLSLPSTITLPSSLATTLTPASSILIPRVASSSDSVTCTTSTTSIATITTTTTTTTAAVLTTVDTATSMTTNSKHTRPEQRRKPQQQEQQQQQKRQQHNRHQHCPCNAHCAHHENCPYKQANDNKERARREREKKELRQRYERVLLDLEMGGLTRQNQPLDTQLANANERLKTHQHQPGEVHKSSISEATASDKETKKGLRVEVDEPVEVVFRLIVPASAALVTVFQRMSEAQRILKTHQLGCRVRQVRRAEIRALVPPSTPEAKADEHLAKVQQRRVYEAWRTVLVKHQVRRENLTEAQNSIQQKVEMVQGRRMLVALRRWRGRAVQGGPSRNASKRVVSRINTTLLVRCLAGWLMGTVKAGAARRQREARERVVRTVSVRAALLRWRGRVVKGKRARLLEASAALWRRKRVLQGYFATWREGTGHGLAAKKLDAWRGRQALTRWRAFTTTSAAWWEASRQAVLVLEGAEQVRVEQLHAAVTQWRDWKRQARGEELLVTRFQAIMQHDKARRRLRAWRALCRLRCMSRVVAGDCAVACLRSAFKVWTQSTQDERARRRHLITAEEATNAVVARRVLGMWRQRARLSALARRVRLRSQLVVLAHWSGLAKDHTVEFALGTLADSYRRQRTLSTGLGGLMSHALVRLNATAGIEWSTVRSRERNLRETWEVWRVETASRRMDRSAEVHWQQRELRKGLLRIREHAQDSIEYKTWEQRLVARVAMKRAWGAWVSAQGHRQRVRSFAGRVEWHQGRRGAQAHLSAWFQAARVSQLAKAGEQRLLQTSLQLWRVCLLRAEAKRRLKQRQTLVCAARCFGSWRGYTRRQNSVNRIGQGLEGRRHRCIARTALGIWRLVLQRRKSIQTATFTRWMLNARAVAVANKAKNHLLRLRAKHAVRTWADAGLRRVARQGAVVRAAAFHEWSTLRWCWRVWRLHARQHKRSAKLKLRADRFRRARSVAMWQDATRESCRDRQQTANMVDAADLLRVLFLFRGWRGALKAAQHGRVATAKVAVVHDMGLRSAAVDQWIAVVRGRQDQNLVLGLAMGFYLQHSCTRVLLDWHAYAADRRRGKRLKAAACAHQQRSAFARWRGRNGLGARRQRLGTSAKVGSERCALRSNLQAWRKQLFTVRHLETVCKKREGERAHEVLRKVVGAWRGLSSSCRSDRRVASAQTSTAVVTRKARMRDAVWHLYARVKEREEDKREVVVAVKAVHAVRSRQTLAVWHEHAGEHARLKAKGRVVAQSIARTVARSVFRQWRLRRQQHHLWQARRHEAVLTLHFSAEVARARRACRAEQELALKIIRIRGILRTSLKFWFDAYHAQADLRLREAAAGRSLLTWRLQRTVSVWRGAASERKVRGLLGHVVAAGSARWCVKEAWMHWLNLAAQRMTEKMARKGAMLRSIRIWKRIAGDRRDARARAAVSTRLGDARVLSKALRGWHAAHAKRSESGDAGGSTLMVVTAVRCVQSHFSMWVDRWREAQREQILEVQATRWHGLVNVARVVAGWRQVAERGQRDCSVTAQIMHLRTQRRFGGWRRAVQHKRGATLLAGTVWRALAEPHWHRWRISVHEQKEEAVWAFSAGRHLRESRLRGALQGWHRASQKALLGTVHLARQHLKAEHHFHAGLCQKVLAHWLGQLRLRRSLDRARVYRAVWLMRGVFNAWSGVVQHAKTVQMQWRRMATRLLYREGATHRVHACVWAYTWWGDYGDSDGDDGGSGIAAVRRWSLQRLLGPPALNGLVSGEALTCQAQRVVFWAWAEYTSMARLRRRAQGHHQRREQHTFFIAWRAVVVGGRRREAAKVQMLHALGGGGQGAEELCKAYIHATGGANAKQLSRVDIAHRLAGLFERKRCLKTGLRAWLFAWRSREHTRQEHSAMRTVHRHALLKLTLRAWGKQMVDRRRNRVVTRLALQAYDYSMVRKCFQDWLRAFLYTHRPVRVPRTQLSFPLPSPSSSSSSSSSLASSRPTLQLPPPAEHLTTRDRIRQDVGSGADKAGSSSSSLALSTSSDASSSSPLIPSAAASGSLVSLSALPVVPDFEFFPSPSSSLALSFRPQTQPIVTSSSASSSASSSSLSSALSLSALSSSLRRGSAAEEDGDGMDGSRYDFFPAPRKRIPS